MDISTQYDNIGQKYIEWQQILFQNNEDTSLRYMESAIWNFENKKILDLWCGDGHYIAYFETKYTCDIWGIDSSRFMIDQAKNLVQNKEKLLVLDIKNINTINQKFDVIYSKYALHYLSDLDQLYKDVSEILNPGGKFVFIIGHPINDLMKKKEPYHLKEIISTSLFSTWAVITYFSHTFSEIASKEFFKHFILEDIVEDYLFGTRYSVPLFIWVTSTKRCV